MDRSVLPIAAPPAPVFNELDAADAKAPPLFRVKAPEGAPNVLIVLIDDLGFAGTSAFGGPVATPDFDALAADGLSFVNFHTTSLCSPTRTALKSGRNHHMNNMGSITELATSFPGNTGQIPDAVAPLAEILRLNGYSTAAFGKWHETAAWEASVAGPFDRWPIRQGFDKFYGFIGGETNQWAPFIYDGVHPVEVPDDASYHFLTDMTDQAVSWIRYQKALTPDRPFFVYYAPGAVHAPHHVPQEWSARWKGKFDQGWDKLREETLARQIARGIVPEGTVLAQTPDAIPRWDGLTGDEKKLFARQVEVFAGYVEMTDHEIGRVIDAIDATGQLDNTLVFLIYGDNGTSAEGGRDGLYNEMTYFNGGRLSVEELLRHYDSWGSADTYPHMAMGWTTVFNTPYAWMKQVGSDHGGTKVGMAVHWPAGIKAKGGKRGQFTHVIDVAPTVLEAAGLPEPRMVNGVPQVPMQGFDEFYGIPPDMSWDAAMYVTTVQLTHFAPASHDMLLAQGPQIVEAMAGGELRKVKPCIPEVRAEIDNELVAKSIDFMKRQTAAGKAFFLYLPFSMGHFPNLPSSQFAGKSRIGQYGDKTMEGDYHVGQILDALKKLGVDNNTLLVFASDNGPQGETARTLGNHATQDMGNSGPFRGELGEATEGSIRTFCFVRWPGHVKPNTTSYAMFSVMDFFPTFANIIGAAVPTDRPIDGVDQIDVLLRTSEIGNRESLLTFIGAQLVAARWKQWRLYFTDIHPSGDGPERLPGAGSASASMAGYPKLFNIEMDPHEDHNVGSQFGWAALPALDEVKKYLESVTKYPNPPAANFTEFVSGGG